MCRLNPSYRYDSGKVLRHPWITRNPSDDIPESLVESFSRTNCIKKFQNTIGALVALCIYKNSNLNLFTNVKKNTKLAKIPKILKNDFEKRNSETLEM